LAKDLSEVNPGQDIEDKLSFVGFITSTTEIIIPDDNLNEKFEFVTEYFNSQVLTAFENPVFLNFHNVIFHR